MACLSVFLLFCVSINFWQGTEKVYIPPPLQPHEVRWFYQEPGKFWLPFGGYDSLCLEQSYLNSMGWGMEGSEVLPDRGVLQVEGQVSVMGDLYSVYVQDRVMVPIYWQCELHYITPQTSHRTCVTDATVFFPVKGKDNSLISHFSNQNCLKPA
jgi:hypothetical protein